MARLDVQGVWEGSLFIAFLLHVWEGSTIYRLIMAVLRYFGRIAPYGTAGQIWLSDWPSGAAFSDSLVGRTLNGLNRWAARWTKFLSSFLGGVWQSSLLVRAYQASARGVGPVLSSSWCVQSLLGYPGDVELAPKDAAKEGIPPFLPMLGAVLGVFALIPSPAPGEGGLNPTVLMVLGIWGTAGLWLVHKLVARDFTWRASSVFLPLTAFLLVAAATTAQSVDRPSSLQALVLWITAGLVFFLTVNLARNSRDVAAFMGPIMAAGVLMALWSVYQFKYPPVIEEHWVDPSEAGLVRTFAGMNNPNYLALFMELYIPVAVALWVQLPKRRLELTGILGCMTIALLLTQSRGGWLGLAVAAVVFVLIRAGRWSFLLVLGAVAMWFVAPASIKARLLTAFNPEHTSNLYRNNIRIGVLRAIGSTGYLGAGLGAPAFANVYQHHMLAAAQAAHAHNIFLQVLGETGILGLGAVLWSLFAALRRTIVVGFDRLRGPIPAAVAAAMIGVLVHGMAEHIWYNPKILFSFWAVVGLGMGLVLGDREGAKA